MFCKQCGATIPDGSTTCPSCGAEITPATNNVDAQINDVASNSSGFFKSKDDKLITGVCAGLGKKYGKNPWLFRAIFIVSMFIPVVDFAVLGFYIYGAIAWKFDDELV